LDKKKKELEAKSRTASGADLDGIVKSLKYISALQSNGLTPDKAYVISKIPVVPPTTRPVIPGKGGQELIYGDINPLYRDLLFVNNQFKEVKQAGTMPFEEAKMRPMLHQAVGAVFGVNDPVTTKSVARGHKGFLTYIAGAGSPKYGFFQSKLMKKQQDITGRGTIVPDSTLGIDQVGLPEDMIWTMYEKFLIRRLVQQGYQPLEAQEMIKARHPAAKEAFQREIKERPVMINRAPTLHRFGIVGAFPVPVPGKTIRINPFVEIGTGSDFDGDTMMIHAPVGHAAVEEVKRMTTSNLLYSDKSRNDLLVVPRMESVMGIASASQQDEHNKSVHYENKADAMKDYNSGKITLGTRVTIGAKK
jgi:DNA-directed RNA polymerase subunit beta'